MSKSVLLNCVTELSKKYGFNLEEACELLKLNEIPERLKVKKSKVTKENKMENKMVNETENVVVSLQEVNDLFNELITMDTPQVVEKKKRVKLTDEQKGLLALERQEKKNKKVKKPTKKEIKEKYEIYTISSVKYYILKGINSSDVFMLYDFESLVEVGMYDSKVEKMVSDIESEFNEKVLEQDEDVIEEKELNV